MDNNTQFGASSHLRDARNQQDPPPSGRLYTVPELAIAAKAGRTTIWGWIRRREIGCYRVGRKVLISQDQLDAKLRTHEVQPFDARRKAREILRPESVSTL